MNYESFGQFLSKKRLEKKLTLRKFAILAELSPVYVSNIENNRQQAPADAVLQRIINVLSLDKTESEEMYDLAAKSKNKPSVSSDLPEYIMEKDIVRMALRTAKDVDATDEEWQDFIDRLMKKKRT